MKYKLLFFFLVAIKFVSAQKITPIYLKSGNYFPDTLMYVSQNEKQNYVILQFRTLPDVTLFYQKYGIKLLEYLPENSFYAKLPSGFKLDQLPESISGVLKIKPEMKLDPSAWSNRKVKDIKLIYFETVDLVQLLKSIELKGYNVLRYYPTFKSIYVQAKLDNSALLNLEEIYWIEPAILDLDAFNLVERNNHRANVIGSIAKPGKGLTGKGIKIGEWDGGDVGSHEDFNARLTVVKKKFGINNHATHVCGTMAGAGNLDPLTKGMAPKAGIYSWDFYGDITAEMDTNYPKYGYTLTQNSYGYSPSDDPCVLRGNYDATSRELDLMVEKYPNLLHVFAAGNSRGDNCRSGGFKTVLSGFQCAKNNLAVAAVTNLDGDAGFSSCGPTRDGRIKPEVSAVGVDVYSTLPNNTYQGGWSGTSMACPGASGTTALLYEYYFSKYSSLPDAHLAKNFMANSADDIGNVGPDFRYGFGRINGRRAIQLIDSKAFQLDSIKQNANDYDTLKIPKGVFKLKIMLCWNDKAASVSANGSLINDLDLSVIDSLGNTYKPWVLDTVSHNSVALRGRDSLNNIEQITIDNPPSGRLIIGVKGKRVTTSFQNYSLTWDIVNTGLTITYPNGLETFPPPSSAPVAQVIRWDAYNLTGNAKIEFSVDKGNTWQVMVGSVAVNQKYYNWNNASDTINTNSALVKITSGTITDLSDSLFTIGKIPSTFSGGVCDSQVHIKWPKQAKAVSYKLYQLINGSMQEIYTGTDTFCTVRKLNNGQPYWFSISNVFKNGGESQRMIAKSYTPSATIKPPKITLDLKDVAGCKNVSLSLKSTASGTATLNSFWQRSIDNGNSWNILNGRVFDTLILANPSFKQNGWKYRRGYFNACEGNVFTNEIKVEIDTALPSFDIPKDTIGCIGANFTLKVYNLSSVSMPYISWIKNYNVIMDPFVYYKRGYETFLNFNNLTTDDNRNIVVSAKNGCGTRIDKLQSGIDLTVAPKLQMKWNDFDTICLGKQYTLKPTLTGGKTAWYKYQWSGPGTVSSKSWIFVKPDTTTLYYFKLNDGGCSVDSLSDSIKIVVRPNLQVYVSNDTTLCEGTSGTLKAWAKGGNLKYNFNWNQGLSSTSKHTIWPKKTTVYYVWLTDSCTTDKPVDSIVVTVLPALQLKLKTLDDTLCIGQNTLVIANVSGGKSKGYSFLWNVSQSDSIIMVSPKITTTYRVVFADGCSSNSVSDSLTIAVRQALSVKINAPDTVCSFIPFISQATSKGGWSKKHVINWSRNTAEGPSKRDSTKIGIWEIATLTDNCTSLPSTDSLWIEVWKLPKIKAANDTTLCYGQNHQFSFTSLGGKNGTVKMWWEFNKALLLNPVSLDPINSGLYHYVAVIKDGCEFSQRDTTTILVLDKLTLNPIRIQKCSTQDSVIQFKTYGGKGSFVNSNWNDGTSGLLKSFNGKSTKKYTVVLSDGCSDTSTVNVEVVVDEFGVNDFRVESVIDKVVVFKATMPQQNAIWDFGDGNSLNTNDTAIEKIFKEYGKYSICRKQTDRIGCLNTACKEIEVIDVLKNNGFTMEVIPNPNQGKFNVLFNKIPGNLKIEVFNALGQSLINHSSLNFVGIEYSMDMGELAAGIYLIRATMNAETISRKIIIR